MGKMEDRHNKPIDHVSEFKFLNVKSVKLSDSIKPTLEIIYGEDQKQIVEDFTHLHYRSIKGKNIDIDFHDIIDLGLRPSKSVFFQMLEPKSVCLLFARQHLIKIFCKK